MMSINSLQKSKRPRKYFTKSEDCIIEECRKRSPPLSWEEISTFLPLRTPRQCRDRWLNYLSPTVNREPWTEEEDRILLEKVEVYGKKWTEIEKYLSGRTNNQIKNRWYFHLNANPKKNFEKSNDESQFDKLDESGDQFWDRFISEDIINFVANNLSWNDTYSQFSNDNF